MPNPDKNASFGDLHVHTSNSFDAYTFGTIASSADAYRFAKGHAIPHPTGYQIQLKNLHLFIVVQMLVINIQQLKLFMLMFHHHKPIISDGDVHLVLPLIGELVLQNYKKN